MEKAHKVYLLAERPQSSSGRLLLVAKGDNRGWLLTPAGLRTIFHYHRLDRRPADPLWSLVW